MSIIFKKYFYFEKNVSRETFYDNTKKALIIKLISALTHYHYSLANFTFVNCW
ncbi:hypothetical protein LAC1533_0019 [Ligilactobacillus acidipiscis]|uniref:Uncharacterized protein n=1 Tax=Ligilactobacillus acidipiscis TaxID=89059 RepID=A0A1K1KKN5_9LACO|nr:hypothetical protein LAC1533_0019 [Ligilactobacillus acidipiscis]